MEATATVETGGLAKAGQVSDRLGSYLGCGVTRTVVRRLVVRQA
jgi:hypothetical protein